NAVTLAFICVARRKPAINTPLITSSSNVPTPAVTIWRVRSAPERFMHDSPTSCPASLAGQVETDRRTRRNFLWHVVDQQRFVAPTLHRGDGRAIEGASRFGRDDANVHRLTRCAHGEFHSHRAADLLV